MGVNIFTDTLMQGIKTKMQEITFSPALKVLTDFDLTRLPNIESLSEIFDFLIIEPVDVSNELSSNVAINAYLQTYTFNLWYGRKGNETVDMNSLKIAEVHKIFEKLSDNIVLPSVTLRAGAIVRSCVPISVVWKNSAHIDMVKKNMQAAIVLMEVRIVMEVRRVV